MLRRTVLVTVVLIALLPLSAQSAPSCTVHPRFAALYAQLQRAIGQQNIGNCLADATLDSNGQAFWQLMEHGEFGWNSTENLAVFLHENGRGWIEVRVQPTPKPPPPAPTQIPSTPTSISPTPIPATPVPVPIPTPAPTLGEVGKVVSLSGTPHLWIVGADNQLHWGGDTRGLAGKHIRWDSALTVNLDQLRTMPIGDPWLSSGLLKSGDPIYLVKWETDWEQPKLLHILSIKDVELFGINGKNYGNFVLDKATWEQRFGILAATLEKAVLASATKQFRVDLRALTNQYIMPHLPNTFYHPQGKRPHVPISDVQLWYYDDDECRGVRENTNSEGYFRYTNNSYVICINSGLVEQEAEQKGISVQERTLLVLVHEYSHPLTIRLMVSCQRSYGSGDTYSKCIHDHYLLDGSSNGNFQTTCEALRGAILPASRFDPC